MYKIDFGAWWNVEIVWWIWTDMYDLVWCVLNLMLVWSSWILGWLGNLESDKLNKFILFSYAKIVWTKSLSKEHQFEHSWLTKHELIRYNNVIC